VSQDAQREVKDEHNRSNREMPNQPVEPELDTETMKIARLETATETIMAYVGSLTNQMIDEENLPNPNKAKLAALREQKKALLHERRSIRTEDERLIAKAIYVYAPIMKALHANRQELARP